MMFQKLKTSFRSIGKHVLLTCALGVFAFQAVAADRVAVRAAEHKDYGRLVLDWGKKQSFEANIQDGFLYISFPNSMEANLRSAERALGSYVSDGEIYNNNKSVKFKLKGNYRLKTAVYGTAIAFDLIPEKKTANGARSVAVRVGEHKDYSRIVVDWPEKTGFEVRQSDQSIDMIFDRAGDLNLRKMKADLPKFVKDVKSSVSGTKTTLSIAPDGYLKVKSFRSGNSIAFDLSPDNSEPKRTAEVAKAPEKAKVENVAKTPVRKITPVEKVEPVQETPVVREKAVEVQEPEKTEAKQESLVQQSAAALEEQAKKENGPKQLVPVSVKETEQKEVTPPSDKMRVEVGNLKDGFRLIFPWKESSAMTLFERAGNYWVVFDKRVAFDFKNLSGPYKFLVLKKRQFDHPTASVARFTVREGYAPSVARIENEWRIDFRLGETPVIENTIDIQSQPATQQGARVFIPAVNNGDKISFQDPQAGDELIAVPLYTPGWGFGRTRTFAQFIVLPSMQGIAMTTKDSSVNVAVERNGVSITADGGLQLSRAISREDLFASGDQTDRFSGKRDKAQLVKLEEWQQVPLKDFQERKQVLQRRVARSPEGGRNAARLELAKFFVGHNYFADAMGVLERIRLDDPRADEDGVYRLLRGLSNLGMHHYEDAGIDLFNPIFNGVAEVAPWRAKVAAAEGDWKRASEELKIGRDAFGVYNTEIANDFNLLSAEAALEDYDIELAALSLENIKSSLAKGVDKKVAAKREYFEGMAALRSGDVGRAIGKFDQAIALDDRPTTAKAKYEKINAQLAQKELTPEEAIEEFKKMTFAWRGDDLELKILKRVGDLQLASGKMREGLQTFRDIVMTFPKSPLARDIAREMNDVFNQLFLEGGAEALPPIKALALYYEYRELTPLGKKGDKMIRNLADRLIKVDLLDQAAQLLDHQVNFRLKGELKALTGTKLAVVHLWNGAPKESLGILYKTRWRALPQSVKDERRYIQARANAELEDYEEALDLLEDDNSQVADEMRADIYWRSKNWPKAISSLEKLMKNNGADRAVKLSNMDRQRLMQIAVARSLAGDQAGITDMRKKYRKLLVDTPDLDAFDLITETSDGSETNFRERSTAIAKIGQLESFMTGYREQLKNGEFWSTN